MKKFYLIVLVLSISTGIFAQVLTSPPERDEDYKTIFDGDNLKIGAFGGPMMTFTVIDGQFSHMMGGGGGIMIGGFYFGGFGMGLTNSITAVDQGNEDLTLEFGYGGLMTGFTLMGKKAVHPTFNANIGWGNVSKEPEFGIPQQQNEDGVFVFEPSVQVEMNFTKFFRVSLGAGYRLVSSCDLPDYGNSDLSGASACLTFKFGWF